MDNSKLLLSSDRDGSVPELLRLAEAASMTALGRRTVGRHVASGQFPKPVRIGGAVRWRRADILQWIEDGCPPVGKS